MPDNFYGEPIQIYDFSKGLWTVDPAEFLPDGASPDCRNVWYDELTSLSKMPGTELLLTEANNAFSVSPTMKLFVYRSTSGQEKLIYQGTDTNNTRMKLWSLDRQSSYPAPVAMTDITPSGGLVLHRRLSMVNYRGYLYIADGTSSLKRWDGETWTEYHATEAEQFKYLCVYDDCLFAACSGHNPTRVIWTYYNKCNFVEYYSVQQKHWKDFPTDHGDPVQGMIVSPRGSLLVFKYYSIHEIQGSPASNSYTAHPVSMSKGTVDIRTVRVWGDNVVFVGERGLYALRGSRIRVSSDDQKLQTEESVIPLSGEIQNFWNNYVTLPDLGKMTELNYSDYTTLCAALDFDAGTDSSNFKADTIGLEPNDFITGGTSGARAKIVAVDVDSGTWAAGTAAGTLYITDIQEALAFTSGGTRYPFEGDEITGATSGATAIVENIVVTSGTWSNGDAAGTMYISNRLGTFEAAETINCGAFTNVATATAASSTFTNNENINLGTKTYAVVNEPSGFTYTIKTGLMEVNKPDVVTSNPAVLNLKFNEHAIAWDSRASQTTVSPDIISWVELDMDDGKNNYFSQSFKAAYDAAPASNYAAPIGTGIYLKETGDFSNGDLKVYITSQNGTNPDFNYVYAEALLDGVFLHGIEQLDFTVCFSEMYIGETVTGATSGATGVIHKVVYRGSGRLWLDAGTKTGTLYLKSVSGTFQSEDLNIGGVKHAEIAGDTSPISTGCWVCVPFTYKDYPQNMYNGNTSSPPTLHLVVRSTGEDASNYMSWGYQSGNLYSNGRMYNSDSDTPVGQSDFDYCFNVYGGGYYYKGYISTNSIDAGADLTCWDKIFITLDTSTTTTTYTRNTELDTVEYEVSASGTFTDTWTETTNGGEISGTGQYVKAQLTFNRPTVWGAADMDSCTVRGIYFTFLTQTLIDRYVDSEVFEDRYWFTCKIVDGTEEIN